MAGCSAPSAWSDRPHNKTRRRDRCTGPAGFGEVFHTERLRAAFDERHRGGQGAAVILTIRFHARVGDSVRCAILAPLFPPTSSTLTVTTSAIPATHPSRDPCRASSADSPYGPTLALFLTHVAIQHELDTNLSEIQGRFDAGDAVHTLSRCSANGRLIH